MHNCKFCNYDCYDQVCTLCCISWGILISQHKVADRYNIISSNIEMLEENLRDIDTLKYCFNVEKSLIHMRSQLEDV